MKLAMGNAHGGVFYKNSIVEYIKEQGHEIVNYRSDSPDYLHPVARAVEAKAVDFGIIICGGGNGANIMANKYQQVRSALCWIKEIAQLAPALNNANVLSIPAHYTSRQQTLELVETFLNMSFRGGRHQLRVSKIACR